ncbi:MAG: tRNA lysidine(34) synthetase TilS [Actinomycetota bacterium]
MDEPRGVNKPLGGPGYPFVKHTEDTIRQRGMLEDGNTVVVAVSGGPDSTCLLDVLRRVQLGLTPVVAHVDHGLSENSETVAARVAKHAAEAGIDVHVARAPDLSGPNLHERARDFRYAFLESIADQVGANAIATAHTLDDRVETTLARLIHGAAPEVLAGLPPAEGRRIRPLIDARRSETRAYCVEGGLDFYDDPANDDVRFERVAVRSKVVRAIEEHWGEGAVRAMAASAEFLRQDSEALDRLAARLYEEVASVADDGIHFDREALIEMPRAFRRRLLQRAVGRVRDRSGGIEQVLDALERPELKPEAHFAVAGGIEISIGRGGVVVRVSNDDRGS